MSLLPWDTPLPARAGPVEAPAVSPQHGVDSLEGESVVHRAWFDIAWPLAPVQIASSTQTESSAT